MIGRIPILLSLASLTALLGGTAGCAYKDACDRYVQAGQDCYTAAGGDASSLTYEALCADYQPEQEEAYTCAAEEVEAMECVGQDSDEVGFFIGFALGGCGLGTEESTGDDDSAADDDTWSPAS